MQTRLSQKHKVDDSVFLEINVVELIRKQKSSRFLIFFKFMSPSWLLGVLIPQISYRFNNIESKQKVIDFLFVEWKWNWNLGNKNILLNNYMKTKNTDY